MAHLEGRQSILAALRARQRKFQVILIRHGTHAAGVDEVISTAEQMGVPIRYVESRELESYAHGASHGGMLAICSAKPQAAIGDVVELIRKSGEPALLLLLEGVDDARNLGFTLRSAEALGVHAVLIKKHLWDFDETEVARPASGAYERLPLAMIDSVEPLQQLQQMGLQLLGCLANVKQTIYDADFARPTIVAIGGEKRGLSGAVRAICDGFVTIPSVGDATSLSLSHAGAIAMSEAMRQRTRNLRKEADNV
jgi:23S rRNA (guanosine2251-2'-O)-methyltransferase